MLKIPKLIFENNFDNVKIEHHLNKIKEELGLKKNVKTLIIIDSYFNVNKFFENLDENYTLIYYYPPNVEPSTDLINSLIDEFRLFSPQLVIGIGGGSVLDTAKAISNLITNDGKSEKYQGWDLLKNPAIAKIAIPTIFGTGSETSSTCVLINESKSLKLGMNSPFSIFDYAIIISNIQKSINLKLLIPTALDSYFHSIEILNGSQRNPIADDFSNLSLELIKSFASSEISDKSLEFISRASIYSGIALTHGMVGIIHPFSAALGVVLKIPHGMGNCIAMNQLREFYEKDYVIFKHLISKYDLDITYNKKIEDLEIKQMIKVMLTNTKPLTNHLGENYLNTLNDSFLTSQFKKLGRQNAR